MALPSCERCLEWRGFFFFFQKSWFDGSELLQVVEDMFQKCDQAKFAKFVRIMRRIWLRRNELIHDGVFLHPNRIVVQAAQAVERYQHLLAERNPRPATNAETLSTHLRAPPPGCFKANWDAGFDSKKGRVGLGVVIRDQQGKVWASKCQTKQGFLDPTTGEAMAALMAAELCVEMGITKVQFEGDAKNVVSTVLSNDPDDSHRGQVIEDIRTTLRAIPWWEARYVRRKENHVAHVLADRAVRDNMNKEWLYNMPECIREPVQVDISTLSDML
jgi:ribonuclease HI